MNSPRRIQPDDHNFPTTPALRARLAATDRLASVAPTSANRAPSGTQEPLPVGARAPLTGEAPHLILGTAGKGDVTISLPRLLAGRCLIQGSSNAGKSKTLRRIVEQAHRFVTTIVVDVEGEFANLANHIGATSVRAVNTTTDGLTAVALRSREHRIPIHLDLTDLEPDVRISKAAAFFTGLIAAPRAHWANSCLVAIDEAHVLAPHLAASARDAEARRLGIAALTDLCSRGRKRGLSTVVAVQRLAKLATSVLAELHNLLIGLNILDRDVSRAADLLGYTYDKAGILRDLKPGQFVALGPAIATLPTVVTVGPTETMHIGGTPALTPAADHDASTARSLLGLDQIAEVQPALAGRSVPVGTRALDSLLLDARAPAAIRIVGALVSISPNATTAAEISAKLHLPSDEVDAALDLLSSINAIDTMPRGADRIARLTARLRVKLGATKVVGLA